MKITGKYILSTVLIVFVTGLFIVAYSANTQKKLIEEQIEKKGSTISEILSVSSVIPMLNYDYSSVKLFFDALSKDSDVLEGELLDNSFIVKMHTNLDRLGEYHDPGDSIAELESTLLTKDSTKGRLLKYDFYSPVRVEDNRIGIFHITLTNETYLKVIRLAWIKMMFLGFFALLIGTVGALILGMQISRPIKKLVAATESVSGGNFKWDVDIRSRDEIGKLSNAFKNMTERLDANIKSRISSEKMAVVGQLSSVIAHEIRNPLEPIKGSAELLKIYYPGEEKIIKFSGIIQEEVLRLISFIDNFLEFARPREPEMKKISMNTMISKTFLLLEKLIQDKNIKADLQLNENLPDVNGDPSMLKQVILNVVLNAVQASEKEKGLITAATDFKDGMAELTVTDNGRGIDSESLGKIFDPFYTTKSEGSGTGLTTSLRIIEQHGGEILVESEPGIRTMVHILLPLYVEEEFRQ